MIKEVPPINDTLFQKKRTLDYKCSCCGCALPSFKPKRLDVAIGNLKYMLAMLGKSLEVC
jgi:hypothetical protein